MFLHGHTYLESIFLVVAYSCKCSLEDMGKLILKQDSWKRLSSIEQAFISLQVHIHEFGEVHSDLFCL